MHSQEYKMRTMHSFMHSSIDRNKTNHQAFVPALSFSKNQKNSTTWMPSCIHMSFVILSK